MFHDTIRHHPIIPLRRLPEPSKRNNHLEVQTRPVLDFQKHCELISPGIDVHRYRKIKDSDEDTRHLHGVVCSMITYSPRYSGAELLEVLSILKPRNLCRLSRVGNVEEGALVVIVWEDYP